MHYDIALPEQDVIKQDDKQQGRNAHCYQDIVEAIYSTLRFFPGRKE